MVASKVLAYNYIKSRIIKFDIKPGQRISEKNIANILSVSLTPVRDAIKELVKQGLIEVFPRSGTYAKKITINDIINMYDLLGCINSLAVCNAIDRVSDSHISNLIEINNCFFEHLKNRDANNILEYDKAFHLKIIEISGNDFIENIYKDISIHSDRVEYISFNYFHSLDSYYEHEEIITSIKNRDKQSARDNMMKNYLHVIGPKSSDKLGIIYEKIEELTE